MEILKTYHFQIDINENAKNQSLDFEAKAELKRKFMALSKYNGYIIKSQRPIIKEVRRENETQTK